MESEPRNNEPIADRVAYLLQPATRADLMPLMGSVGILMGTVIKAVNALGEHYSKEFDGDFDPSPYAALVKLADELAPLQEMSVALHRKIQEFGNAGVAPESDHRT